jgi:hypothetical protein
MRIGPSGDAKSPKLMMRLRRIRLRERHVPEIGHEPLDGAVLPERVLARRAARGMLLDRLRCRGRRFPAGQSHQIRLDRTT